MSGETEKQKYYFVAEVTVHSDLDKCYAGLWGPYTDRKDAEEQVKDLTTARNGAAIVEFNTPWLPMSS